MRKYWVLIAILVQLGGLLPARSQEGSGDETAEPHAPPPFSAAVLSQSLAVGEMWRYRLTQLPEPPVVLTMRVISVTAGGAEIESTVTAEDGSLVAPAEVGFSSWDELESHAHYPVSATEVENADVTVEGGTFHGPRYRVNMPDGTLLEASFAEDMPGPPVLYVMTMSGSPVMSMELLSHEASPEGTE